MEKHVALSGEHLEAVACTAAASAGMLRDASVIEASTAPASAAEGSAGGGATDSTVCTAAHEGKTLKKYEHESSCVVK